MLSVLVKAYVLEKQVYVNAFPDMKVKLVNALPVLIHVRVMVDANILKISGMPPPLSISQMLPTRSTSKHIGVLNLRLGLY
jgi:hypothetical protein